MVKRQNFFKALQRLQEAVEMPYSVIVRDAAIQRFEFTFELAWKALKGYLKEVHGIICNSPKQCFREGFSLDLYDEAVTRALLKMVDDRNETTHTYDEKRIDYIFLNIKNDYMQKLKAIYMIVSGSAEEI